MTKAEAIELLRELSNFVATPPETDEAINMAIEALEQEPKWISVTERLPKVNQIVLLSSSRGRVYIGSRDKPDIIWQVTESDGGKLWVYDPESYDCDIDTLPKNEDCGFSSASRYGEDCWLSTTSPNCDLRFEAIIAWQPLPEPYETGSEE